MLDKVANARERLGGMLDTEDPAATSWLMHFKGLIHECTTLKGAMAASLRVEMISAITRYQEAVKAGHTKAPLDLIHHTYKCLVAPAPPAPVAPAPAPVAPAPVAPATPAPATVWSLPPHQQGALQQLLMPSPQQAPYVPSVSVGIPPVPQVTQVRQALPITHVPLGSQALPLPQVPSGSHSHLFRPPSSSTPLDSTTSSQPNLTNVSLSNLSLPSVLGVIGGLQASPATETQEDLNTPDVTQN